MSPAQLPPYLTAEFIKDVLIAICKDADETPTKEGVDWLTGIAKESPPDTLQLRRARLGPTSTLELAKRLEGVDLPTIDLFENAVKDVGFMALSKFAERHFALKRLNCGCCGLTSDAAISIADALRENCGLEAVELGIPSGYIFESASQKERESAYANEIDEQGIIYLARSLAQNTHLKYLGLSGSHIGQREGASALGRLLATNATITALDVSFCALRDSGAAALLGGLSNNNTLEILRLTGNDITFLSVPHLAAALAEPSCPISELFLDLNPLGPEGSRALARGIVANTSLTRLSVSDCALTDNGASILCAAVAGAGEATIELHAELAEVSWALNDEIIDNFMRNIAERARDGQDGLGDEFLNDIEEEKRILIVNHKGRVLSATRLRRTPVLNVRTGQRIWSADEVHKHDNAEVEETNLRLEDIVNYNNLDELEPPEESESNPPEQSPLLSGENVAENRYFETNELETRVDHLESSRVDDFHSASGINYRQSASQITYFSIGGNGIGSRTIRCVCELLRLGCLCQLDMQRNRIGDYNVIQLAETLLSNELSLTGFEKRVLEFNPDIYEVNSPNETITHLNLRKCAISDAGFAALSVAFSALPNALSLDVRDNFIGERGGKKGVFYLCRSSAILKCRLEGNQINHTSKTTLERHLKENEQRVTMNAPKRLEAKITDTKQQVQRLEVSREEMQFLKESVEILQHYIQQVHEQELEAEEQSIRQIANLKSRQEQQIAQTDVLQREIEESREKQVQLVAQTEERALLNTDSLAATQSTYNHAMAKHEELSSKAAGRGAELARMKEDIRNELELEIEELEAIQALKSRASGLFEQIGIKFKVQCKRALESQIPFKFSIEYDREQLQPTMGRVEKIIAGAKEIPQIKLYDCMALDFAPPKRARSSKSARSKSGRKSKK